MPALIFYITENSSRENADAFVFITGMIHYNRGRFQEDWGSSHKQNFTESSLNNYRKRGIVYTIGK